LAKERKSITNKFKSGRKLNEHTLSTMAITACAAIGFAGAALADAGNSPTLQRIAERGYVTIGHRENAVLVLVMQKSLNGYSIDICLNIAGNQTELGIDALSVKYVPRHGQTCIPLDRKWHD
jgi:glutamate/aspartate transport system substrate-binding protein